MRGLKKWHKAKNSIESSGFLFILYHSYHCVLTMRLAAACKKRF
ncbi:hypothetical protein B4168_0476 [Anoxybacillus flavithermus]|nr:hypothetical protein B4168_0476 [Anoxybacillus flavithermus]OAO87130.1 hypothetical protein GT23_1473 [Parageobacillus thermoglucosidasius]